MLQDDDITMLLLKSSVSIKYCMMTSDVKIRSSIKTLSDSLAEFLIASMMISFGSNWSFVRVIRTSMMISLPPLIASSNKSSLKSSWYFSLWRMRTNDVNFRIFINAGIFWRREIFEAWNEVVDLSPIVSWLRRCDIEFSLLQIIPCFEPRASKVGGICLQIIPEGRRIIDLSATQRTFRIIWEFYQIGSRFMTS